MDKPILDRVMPILCDPITGASLRKEEGQFISETGRFPIIRAVPRFVAGDDYVSSFSFEWNTHYRTQLDCFRSDRSSEEQFIKKTGFGQAIFGASLYLTQALERVDIRML